jgi:hypothetical protein
MVTSMGTSILLDDDMTSNVGDIQELVVLSMFI